MRVQNLLRESDITIKNFDQTFYHSPYYLNNNSLKKTYKQQLESSNTTAKQNEYFKSIAPPRFVIIPPGDYDREFYLTKFLTKPEIVNYGFVCSNCKKIVLNGFSIGSRGCFSHTGSKVPAGHLSSQINPLLYNNKRIGYEYNPSDDTRKFQREVWSCCNTVVNYADGDSYHGENTHFEIGCKASDHWNDKAILPTPELRGPIEVARISSLGEVSGFSGSSQNYLRMSFLCYMYYFVEKLIIGASSEELVCLLKNIKGIKLIDFNLYQLNRTLLYEFAVSIETRKRGENEILKSGSAYLDTDLINDGAQQYAYDPSFSVHMSTNTTEDSDGSNLIENSLEPTTRSYVNFIDDLNKQKFEDIQYKIQTKEISLDDDLRLIMFGTLYGIVSMDISQRVPLFNLNEGLRTKNANQIMEHKIYYFPRIDIVVERVDRTFSSSSY
jgi:hypothetical protein